MPRTRILLVSLLAAATAGCNLFAGEPAVRVGNSDPMVHTRWNGQLTSPESLAGVAQMRGSATMASSAEGDGTLVTVDLNNAVPGGEHPWELRSGRCGAAGAVFGSADAYEPLEVESDGRATASVTIPETTPERGEYHVAIYASAGNRSMVVACANLAPPTR